MVHGGDPAANSRKGCAETHAWDTWMEVLRIFHANYVVLNF